MRLGGLALLLVLALASSAMAHSPTGEYQTFGDAPRDTTIQYPLGLDKSRIPIVQYDGFWAYNPVAIAQYGLARYSLWKRYGDRSRYVQAKRAADWLVREQHDDGAWTYYFNWNVRDRGVLTAPWKSALAQGQAIPLLRRLYHVTGKRHYLTAAIKALKPLSVRVAKDGLARHSWGGLWFEEYPTPLPFRALSGHMQTVLGLYDLAALSPKARDLYQRGRRALANGLRYYNFKGWSLYATAKSRNAPWLATPGYQQSHIAVLRILNDLRPHGAFRYWASEWAKSTTPPSLATP